MKYCRKCGSALDDNVVYCITCGEYQNNTVTTTEDEDKGGFLWGLLGCFIPVAGLALYLVWNDKKPKTAKAAGIGAIIGVAVAFLWIIFIWVIIFFAALMFAGL